ncbi:MAG: LCP family protein, partial [Eubacteriales bacterium]|nr:LCP family protein [Eubacteriales bacterium]
MDTLNYVEIEKETVSQADDTDNANTVKTDSLLSNEYVLNILLFGQDAHGSGENDYGRSDTIILLSLDNLHKKIKLTSFQRDTYVTVPGYGDGKLNSAFSLGGVPLAVEMIEANFGIQVDKYACVDFNSFRKIVNVLGGVDIELSIDEIEYINAQIDVNNQLSKTEFLPIDYSKETQVVHLDGYQALWYARNRGAENLGGNPA